MNSVCRLCRSWILQRRIQTQRLQLERVAFAWSHDTILARDLAALAARSTARDLTLSRADADLRVALYRALLTAYRQYQHDHREVLSFAPGEQMSTAHTPMVGAVRRAIRRLDERQRIIVSLIDLGGCSYTDVGRILLVSPTELIADLCAARAQLKTQLLNAHAATRGSGMAWGA